MNPNSKDLVAILKQARKSKGISVRHMGDLLGISHQAYTKIENGETKLTFDNLVTMCKIIGVDVRDVMGILDSTEATTFAVTLTKDEVETLAKTGQILGRIAKDAESIQKARDAKKPGAKEAKKDS